MLHCTKRKKTKRNETCMHMIMMRGVCAPNVEVRFPFAVQREPSRASRALLPLHSKRNLTLSFAVHVSYGIWTYVYGLDSFEGSGEEWYGAARRERQGQVSFHCAQEPSRASRGTVACASIKRLRGVQCCIALETWHEPTNPTITSINDMDKPILHI